MRTRLRSFLFLSFLGITALSFGQSAELTSESISDEADVRSNNDSIVITLTGDTFVGNVDTNNGAAETFLAGFSGGSAAWDAIIFDMLDDSHTDERRHCHPC